MKQSIATLLLIQLLYAVGLQAQPQCDLKTFTNKDGLASNMISSVVQDNNQLLWVGTWNGLCYFDGYEFHSVTNNLDASVNVNNHLQSIKANWRGGIWCLNYDKSLFLYDTRQKRLVDFAPIIERATKKSLSLRNIYAMPDGHTWITCQKPARELLCIDDDTAPDGKGLSIYEVKSKGKDVVARKVERDDDGRIWIFTSAGVELYGGDIVAYRPYGLMQQVDAAVFFASDDGHLARYDTRKKKMVDIALPKTVTHIGGMLRTKSNRLAVATDIGIIMFDGNGRMTACIQTQAKSRQQAHIVAFDSDSHGGLWAFTETSGVWLADTRTLTATWLDFPTISPLAATTSKQPFLIEDSDGTIWLAPSKGTFSYYDSNTATLRPYILGKTDTHTDIPDIDKKYVDSQKNIWILSVHNLTRVNLLNRRIKNVVLQPNTDVRAIGTTANGFIYAGLNNGRLIRLDSDCKPLCAIGTNLLPSQSPFSPDGRIYSMFTDSHQRTWIGTKGDGLYLIDGGKTRHFSYNKANPFSISGDEIYDFYEDSHHRIWIACFDHGLNLVDEQADGTMRFINTNNALKSYPSERFCNKVRRITGTKDKTIVLTTAGGMVTFSEDFSKLDDIKYNVCTRIDNNDRGLSGNTLMQTIAATDGRLYISTSAGGLAVSEGDVLSEDLHFTRIDKGEQRTGIILSMVEDDNGDLWLARENLLERYNIRTKETDAFGYNDIGRDVSFTEAKPLYDNRTHSLILGINGGLVVFNPHSLKKNERKPKIVFTTVQFQKDQQLEHILFTDELDVPSDKRNLTLSFAALDYRDQSETKYAYMIEGVDRKWNYIGTRHSISFNGLPSGHLHLLVRSTNADGVWVKNTAVLRINSHPTFWETGWAWLLYAMLACGIVAVAVYVITLKRKAQMEEEMNTLRTNFYTEASHRLRTPLTLIGGPTAEVLEGNNIDQRERSLLEMVLRNTRHMLDLVNKMLEHGSKRNYFVDDSNAPVFAASASDESLVALTNTEGDKSLRLLVVEDNDDLRHFLVSILNHDYTVLAAANGKEGLDTAIRDMPDFIITDVNMPVMDGFEMVHNIKQNHDTCHIPIIVLSAKASLDDKLKGLSEGVDDYITKPFSATYLKRRIENIVTQRRMLQEAMLEHITHSTEKAEVGNRGASDGDTTQTASATATTTEQQGKEATVGKAKANDALSLSDMRLEKTDQLMMERLMAYIDKNLSNSDMKIADLATEVGMSRTVFYGKVKAIVGMSPVDFVRYLRLQRAERLVANTDTPLSNIAYEVGFTDPNYFGKCFKKAMGMPPSDYRLSKTVNNKQSN